MGRVAILVIIAALVGVQGDAQYSPPSGGGGGSGTVTSVGLAGTANQVTVTGASPITGSGSWTLSFPAGGVTLPGTTTGTFSGNLTGNASGNNPVGGLGAVQLYSTATAFTGDNTKLFSNLTALSSAAPVITQGGTPGAVTYSYKFVPKNSIGIGSGSNATTGTTTTGNATIDGTNYNIVTPPCTGLPAATIGSIYLTDGPGDTGLLVQDHTCGTAYNDQTGQGDFGNDPPTVDRTVGLYTSGELTLGGGFRVTKHSSFGTDAIPDMEGLADITVGSIMTEAGEQTQLIIRASSLPVDDGAVHRGVFIYGSNDSADTTAFTTMVGLSTYYSYNGDVGGTLENLFGAYSQISKEGPGNLTLMVDFYSSGCTNIGSGDIEECAAFYSKSPVNSGGGTTGANFVLYAQDQINADIPNSYFLWLDGIGTGAGVWRVNALGIMAYYNPSFAAYTPGAADYERIVQQWTSDVAEIGTQAGGTGTLRNVRLLGTQVLVESLKTTGAATGKTVVCVDVTTGQLYASTSGVACAN